MKINLRYAHLCPIKFIDNTTQGMSSYAYRWNNKDITYKGNTGGNKLERQGTSTYGLERINI